MFQNPEIAFGGTRPMLEIIETIYAAVQRPELWSKVMDDMAAAIRGGPLTIWAAQPESQMFATTTQMDPALWDSYVDYYASINTLIANCEVKFADGEVRYSHLAMSDADFRRTEFCNDFFVPNGMYHSMGLKIPLHNLPAALLSCQRPEAMGVFTEREGLVYETLMPHLQRALSLNAHRMQMQANLLGLEAALDAHEHAVIGLDETARIVFSNALAEAYLAAGHGLGVKNKRLVCTSSTVADTHLQSMLKRETGLATGLRSPADGPSTLMIERGASRQAMQLTVFPFQSKLAGQGTRLAALVFLSSPADKPRPRAAALQTLYALTPTEARVADLLLQQIEIKDVADRLHIHVETCRHHVKRALAKTGTKKQSELIRLMLKLPAI